MQRVHRRYTMRMYAVYGLGGLRRRAVGSVNERLMFGAVDGVGWVQPTMRARVGCTHPTLAA